MVLFKCLDEETSNYKRFRDHYKGLLARSTVFQIELSLMQDILRKCSFIDWRDKVEDTHAKLSKHEPLSLDQLTSLLEEGRGKLFLAKTGRAYKIVDVQDGDPIQPLCSNFSSLKQVISLHSGARVFEEDLKKALKQISCEQADNQSSDSSWP